MATTQARTQRCVQVRSKHIADHFGDSQLTVDLKAKVASYDVANVTVEWGYRELLAFKNQIDLAVDLLTPPTPTGRVYAPKMSNH